MSLSLVIQISQFQTKISEEVDLVCIDGNLSAASIDYICYLCQQHSIPGLLVLPRPPRYTSLLSTPLPLHLFPLPLSFPYSPPAGFPIPLFPQPLSAPYSSFPPTSLSLSCLSPPYASLPSPPIPLSILTLLVNLKVGGEFLGENSSLPGRIFLP